MAKQDYIIKNREWLVAKASEPGVKALELLKEILK